MTYCVATILDTGLVFLADSRTNAGVDQINTFRKMHVFQRPDDRVLVLMTSGNLAVTQSRGLARAIGDRLEEEGLAEVGGIRVNISGCMNSCGHHHTADIGFFGAERRAHDVAAPGYQMLLGGYVGQAQAHFGDRAMRIPAKNGPEAVIRVVRRFTGERAAGESFRGWMDRVGGAKAIANESLKDLDNFPSPLEAPDMYVDWDETNPFMVELGASECA